MLLHMIRDAAFWDESTKPSIDPDQRAACKARGQGRLPYQGGGLSTLRRPILLLGTVGFYSLEPINSGKREGSYKLRGWRYAPKTQKPVPSTYNLRIPIGDCMLFPVSGAQLKFFSSEDPARKCGWDVWH